MFSFISIRLYSAVFYWVIFLLSITTAIKYIISPDNRNLLRYQNQIGAMILFTILALYIGMRPISWIFQDMLTYARGFEILGNMQHVKFEGEWFFSLLMYICKQMQWPIEYFFLIVGVGYVGFQTLAGKKLLEENVWLALLFVFSAFSFWGFGTNGIRNGLGCAFAILGIVYLIEKKFLLCAVLYILAIATHRSTTLPIIMSLLACFIIRSPKQAIYFWLSSIIISLIAGNTITGFFASLGFDDRMTMYANMSTTGGYFAHTGFRWDFLLYSAVPVFLTWHITQNRKIQDRAFNILAITYILSNSFWIMIIRAAFSNRFAYLSWFIYPYILAYALIRLHVWEDQDKKVGWALIAHATFTIFMFIIGKLY